MLELSIGTWRITIRRTDPEIIDLARMYNAAAWLWHPILSLFGYSRAYKKLFDALAADGWLQDLSAGTRILDGGIGTAALSLALANATGYAHEIHGIDIAPRMLAQARRNLRRFKRLRQTTQLRYGNVECLPYPTGHFDFVMSAHTLEHSGDPLETIKEMTRVLRAGGPLLVVTTRADRIGVLHGLRWRYRILESHQIRHWLHEAGLGEVRGYALDRGWSLPGPSSEAVIGRKA